MFQAGYHPVEAVAAFVFLERVDLVDDDGADSPEVFARPERVVDALVGPDDNVGFGSKRLPSSAMRLAPTRSDTSPCRRSAP